MSFSAAIPVADMASANAALEAAGWGAGNFSVAAYTGATPTYALLHAWGPSDFIAAVKALPNVSWSEAAGSPKDRVDAIVSGLSGYWGDPLPLEGQTQAGKLYEDADGQMWWCIQPYDTATFPDPSAIPALIRPARSPGTVQPWVQPIDPFDAYKLENPFTGEPDRVTHSGEVWTVTAADASGNNIWEPGVFGWTGDRGGTSGDTPPSTTDEWAAGTTYATGDEVTYEGVTYRCIQGHTAIVGWHPPAVPALWSVV